MPFPLKLGRKVLELAGAAVKDLPLARTEVQLVRRLDACESKATYRTRIKGLCYKFRNKQDEGAYGCYSRNNNAFWGGGNKRRKLNPTFDRKQGEE